MQYTCYDKRKVEINSYAEIFCVESGMEFSVGIKADKMVILLESFKDEKDANLFRDWLTKTKKFLKGKFRFEDFEDEILYCRDE